MSSLFLSRSSQDAYRQQTNSKPPISHIRKKCACGQIVTAKQLTQYGKCDKCVVESRKVAP